MAENTPHTPLRSAEEIESVTHTEADVLRAKFVEMVVPTLTTLSGVDMGYVSEKIAPLITGQAQVLVVKGGAPSSEKDAAAVKDALHKALEALGYVPAAVSFIRLGEEAAADLGVRRSLAETVIELADPEAVVAIDEAGWELIGEGVKPTATKKHGRGLVYTGDFEAALSDEKSKQRAWAHLKSIKRVEEIY